MPFPNTPLLLPLVILDTLFFDRFQTLGVLPSDNPLLNIDFTADQYSTPNRVFYPLIVNDTLDFSLRRDPQFYILSLIT